MRLTGVFLLALSFSLTYAQKNPSFFSFGSHYGFIIPHSPELRQISESAPYGFDLSWSTMKLDNDSWSICNCYARSGVTLAYFNYQNPRQLGSAWNAYYFVQPFFKPRGDFNFSLKAGAGVTYLTQVYDAETNPENLFFSSDISFFLLLSPALTYHVSEQLALEANLNYNHISNGGMSQPNKGMNFPTASLSLTKKIKWAEPEIKPDSIRQRPEKWIGYAGLYGSLRSADEAQQSSNHLLAGLNLGVLRSISTLNGFNAGIEIARDDSYRRRLEISGDSGSEWVSAVMLGHHFHIGRVLFLQQFGYYLTVPESIVAKDIFQRYSLYYRFLGNISAGISLIAYGHVADHMDFRILYTF
jgi:hypothetical protein